MFCVILNAKPKKHQFQPPTSYDFRPPMNPASSCPSPVTRVESASGSGMGIFRQAVDSGDPLFQDGGIPGNIHVDHRGAALEVEPDSAGIGGEEDPATGIFLETGHESLALLGRHPAVQMDITDAVLREDPLHQLVHSEPLAEDDHLLAPLE